MSRTTAAALLLAAFAGCGEQPVEESVVEDDPESRKTDSRRIRFDHILISFQGAHENLASLRPREEAKRLARSLHDRVLSGIDFDMLKQRFSDDRSRKTGRVLGPYTIVDYGVIPGRGEIPRAHYAARPANMLFRMKVGEVRLAEFDPKECPFGFHILKRIE
jgi:hypothetical protein